MKTFLHPASPSDIDAIAGFMAVTFENDPPMTAILGKLTTSPPAHTTYSAISCKLAHSSTEQSTLCATLTVVTSLAPPFGTPQTVDTPLFTTFSKHQTSSKPLV